MCDAGKLAQDVILTGATSTAADAAAAAAERNYNSTHHADVDDESVAAAAAATTTTLSISSFICTTTPPVPLRRSVAYQIGEGSRRSPLKHDTNFGMLSKLLKTCSCIIALL